MATANNQAASKPQKLKQPDHPTLDLLRQRWERLNYHNEHWMCCIVGQEGVGKSYTALKIARELDPTFDETRVIFDVAEFLRVLRDDEYEPGQLYVIDEAGVSLGNRTWQDSEQVKLNQALQLIRSHNLGLVFTLPRLSELDSQTEGRLQDVIELREKEDDEYVEGTWWVLDIDRMNMSSGRDGVFKQKPQWRGSEVGQVRFLPPNGDYIDRYEDIKSEFQTETYADIIDEDGDKEDDQSPELLSLIDRLASEGVESYLTWHGGHNKPILSTEKIRMEHDLSHRDAKLVKDELEDDPQVDISEAWERRAEG